MIAPRGNCNQTIISHSYACIYIYIYTQGLRITRRTCQELDLFPDYLNYVAFHCQFVPRYVYTIYIFIYTSCPYVLHLHWRKIYLIGHIFSHRLPNLHIKTFYIYIYIYIPCAYMYLAIFIPLITSCLTGSQFRTFSYFSRRTGYVLL